MTTDRAAVSTLEPPARSRADRTPACDVCGGPAGDSRLYDCAECGRLFHLGRFADHRSLNCGEVLPGVACGVSAACAPCARRLRARERAAQGTAQR